MQKKEAKIKDLDGVIIGRIPVQNKAIKAVPKMLYHFLTRTPRTGLYRPLPDKLVVARTVVNEPMGLGETVDYLYHKYRWVMPGVKNALEQQAQIADLFGSTGRHAKKGWIDMTEETLRRGGVLDLFEGIDYTPEGTKGVQSKAATIDRLAGIYGIENLEYDDDNPFDAFPIAERFPQLKVNLIQDWSSGVLYTAEERRRYPNVRRVARVGVPRNIAPK